MTHRGGKCGMQEDSVKIIGGAFGYTEVIINDEFQVPLTRKNQKIIEENLRIIKELEKTKKQIK